ncbi:chitobiase/beta-hexosaminidase C-terminal domain-containing protein [Leptospira jelokensis]|uniref:chitobiase/beta-hexosaminidase C-terminal domain-containing protein n=1 Tax=Leptospira jelokensis TaxID=2484931 RepID=UPI00109137D2|nr:chitobiase/beta-hexosaminidase C-terminal domain-containing protein [Leptospira jelokensis]TGM04603.1 chitobiase [Leptospira jelokensis]
MRKKLFLLSFLSFFTFQCVGILPDGSSQQGFNPFVFLLGLIGGSPSSSQDLSPGTTLDLSGDGKTDATLVDSDGDGVSDGISLTGGTTPNLILLDTNGDGIPDAVDSNGDGIADYYISPNPPGFLTTAPGGTGNPVAIIMDSNGNPVGFDTDGDGVANDTAIVAILSDTTPPTLTSSLLAGSYSTAQTTTLTCSDNRAPGSIVYTLDASSPSFSPKTGTVFNRSSQSISLSTEGNHTLQALCRDLAGNLSAPLNITYTIDSQIPAITVVSQTATAISSQVGAISSSTITWRTNRSGSFVIREGSDCSQGTLVTSGNASANADQPFQRSHSNFTGEGTKTYRICVTGSNGLTGFASATLMRDDTAPTVNTSPGAGNFSLATSVSASCSDTGGSGCDKIAYAVQVGSSPNNPSIQGTTGTITSGNLYNASLAMTDGSTTYTKFVARDHAGNVSSVHAQNYTVDTEVANITVNTYTQAINGSSHVSLHWQSSKAGTYQIRIGGTNCSNGTAVSNGGNNSNATGNASASTEITSTIANSQFAEGDNTVRICVANLVGSFGSNSRTIQKDTTAPVVTMASPSGVGPFATGTQLQLSCSDTNGTGCDKIIYTLNGTEPTFDGSGAVTNGSVYTAPVALSDGANQVRYLARDLAGNVSAGGNQSFHVGPPNAPSFVEAQASGTSAFVQWWPVTGATSYTVYYSTSPGVTTTATSFGPVTNFYTTIPGLNTNTLYYFRVVASNSGGSSALSNIEFPAYTSSTLPGLSESGIHVDISAGQGENTGFNSIPIVDYFNKKVLITTSTSSINNVNLFSCDFDGTNCTFSDISAGHGDNHGYEPKPIIDFINQKLLVVTYSLINYVPNLFRCDLDGTNCTHKVVNQNLAPGTAGNNPTITIDYINQKILFISTNHYNQSKLSLIRCNLDTTNCAYHDISAMQGSNTGFMPSVTFDLINLKLLIATNNGANSNKPSLFRCELDGTACVHKDISSGQGSNSGRYPQIFIDYEGEKLLVITQTGMITRLFLCNLEGSTCEVKDISANNTGGGGPIQNVTLDRTNRKILLVIVNPSDNYPRLIRCNMDGTNCDSKNISSGVKSGLFASQVLNAMTGKIYVSGTNHENGKRPGLFIW